jgi:hypothetical protein
MSCSLCIGSPRPPETDDLLGEAANDIAAGRQLRRCRSPRSVAGSTGVAGPASRGAARCARTGSGWWSARARTPPPTPGPCLVDRGQVDRVGQCVGLAAEVLVGALGVVGDVDRQVHVVPVAAVLGAGLGTGFGRVRPAAPSDRLVVGQDRRALGERAEPGAGYRVVGLSGLARKFVGGQVQAVGSLR